MLMTYSAQSMDGKPEHNNHVTLNLTDVSREQAEVSLRHLVKRTEVGSGSANSHLKRYVRKGAVETSINT